MTNALASVRVRLTAWYVVVTAAFLVVFGAATYALLRHELRRRTDASLVAAARSVESNLRLELVAEPARPPESLIEEEAGELPLPQRIAVFRADGTLVVPRDDEFPVSLKRVRRKLVLGHRSKPFATLEEKSDRPVRTFLYPMSIAGRNYVAVVALSLEDQLRLLESVRMALLIGIPLWVALAGALGYVLVTKALDPVRAMSAEAAAIGGTDLTRRVPVDNPRDELGQLALTFNALLDRVTAVVEQQRRFITDAAHELRTPVAIVRGEAEVALSKDDRSAAELRQSLTVIEQESRSMSAAIDDFFLLARADAGQSVLQSTSFYLDEVIAEAVRSLQSLAAKKAISLRANIVADSQLEADERLVRRMLVNLVENALKYTPEGGEIDVALSRSDAGYIITVHDSGAPIAPDLRERIFERFYRASPASAEPGAGLGLPIARRITELHGGTVELMDGEKGNTFRVMLPARIAGQRPA